ncbi:MAG: hypothetical protein SNJ81_17130, partial [Cyanobacteriota bacterium]
YRSSNTPTPTHAYTVPLITTSSPSLTLRFLSPVIRTVPSQKVYIGIHYEQQSISEAPGAV